jgi:hypothetical protein
MAIKRPVRLWRTSPQWKALSFCAMVQAITWETDQPYILEIVIARSHRPRTRLDSVGRCAATFCGRGVRRAERLEREGNRMGNPYDGPRRDCSPPAIDDEIVDTFVRTHHAATTRETLTSCFSVMVYFQDVSCCSLLFMMASNGGWRWLRGRDRFVTVLVQKSANLSDEIPFGKQRLFSRNYAGMASSICAGKAKHGVHE